MNALDALRGDLKNHQVKVKLPGEDRIRKFSLIMVSAKTSILDDIKRDYPDANTTQIELTKRLFKDSKKNQLYGVFVDIEKLAYVFAFNMAYAEYDAKTEAVVYRDLDDFLLNELNEKPGKKGQVQGTTDEQKILDELRLVHRRRRGSGSSYCDHHVLIKYAVTEKPASA